ncbi:unnamed protein product [Effrenium voratum]|uniref:Uncharacterized protein n=1 Tax=Effrenium voratum TaxID=2562239 RepID=A0AA36I379_9DINO|nr:unnamed protein product [Effrenium voratum]
MTEIVHLCIGMWQFGLQGGSAWKGHWLSRIGLTAVAGTLQSVGDTQRSKQGRWQVAKLQRLATDDNSLCCSSLKWFAVDAGPCSIAQLMASTLQRPRWPEVVSLPRQ